MPLRQVVHAVRPAPAVERVGHEHGVVDRRHGDAVLCEHGHVVLDVLPDLDDRGVLEQWLQRIQNLAQPELRDAGVLAEIERTCRRAVTERDVAGEIRRHAEGDANQLRLHGIEAGGLGIDGDASGILRHRNPELQTLQRRDGLVLAAVDRRRRRLGDQRKHSRRCASAVRLALRAGRPRLCRLAGGGRLRRWAVLQRRHRLPQRIGDALGERRELHLAQKTEQVRRLRLVHAHLLQRDLNGYIELQGHEIARHACLVGELDQLLAPLGLLDLAGPRQQRIEIAVFLDQLGGGLDADARHTRHIVHRVTGQRLHVDHLVRRHAELLDHLVRSNPPVLHGVEHGDAGLHELHQILVRGDNGDVGAGLRRLDRIGGDQIVGLVAHLLDAGDVEGLHRIADQRELRHQLFRRRRSVCLVVGVDVVAEALLRRVENHRQMRRPVRQLGVAEQLPQHGAEAVHGPYRQTVRWSRERRQRVKSPEDVAGPVDEIDVAALDDGHGLALRHRAGGGWLCFLGGCGGHGRGI